MWRILGISLLSAAVLAFGGCGTSNALPPTSPQPQPTPAVGPVSITSISPSSAAPGNPDLTVTITGSNLDLRHTGSHQTNTVAVWSAGGVDTSLITTVVTGTQITAVVPASLLSKPITAQISVQKWYFADDTPFAVSNSLGFSVASASPNAPFISPPSATLGPKGSQQFTASIENSSSVAWNIEEGAIGGSISATGLYTPANAALST